MNPLNWPAGSFLLFYILFTGAILLALAFWRARLGSSQASAEGEGLDAIHFAYLAGGPARAADTVLVGLFEAGAVYGAANTQYRLAGQDMCWPERLQPYAIPFAGRLRRQNFQSQLRSRNATIHAELVARGLVPGHATILEFRLAVILALASPLLLGVCKIIVGSERGHPVGFLTMLVLATAIIGPLTICRGPFRTRAGTRTLAQIRKQRARAVRAPVGDEILLAFALTGSAVLAGRAYQPFFGSSGDAGGGSGCGGGGCGGGCGGCS